MKVRVNIPSPLRQHVDGQSSVALEGATVGAVLDALVAAHPGLKPRLLDEKGALRRYVNVYVNEDDIRDLDGLATKLAARDAVTLVPAVSGGSR